MARISVILVNWNTRALLQSCLQSVFASAGDLSDLEVLVVDNGSKDGSPEMVASQFPRVALIASRENLGFARANNLAIRRATGDYLLLLNPDTEMLGAALPKLLAYAEEHPEVAIVGPQLLFPNGSVQSSRRRFPTRLTAFLESTVLQRWLPNHPILRSYYVLDRSDENTQEVDWLVGAALFVRAKAARDVGLFDEGYFMYSEELDWCRRFARKGWRICYYPEAQVIHHEGQSSGQDVLSRHNRFQYSKARYFEKYHGGAFAQLLRAFILGNYLLQLAEESIKLLLVSRNRPARRQRISVLARASGWMALWALRWGRLAP